MVLRVVFFVLSFLIFFINPAVAVFVTHPVEVHLSIEDGGMQEASISSVTFDGEEVDISKKNFMNRKISKTYTLCPDQYLVEWTTVKLEKPWGGEKIEKKHQKVVVLEITDAVVYINIRAEGFTVY